MYSLFNIISFFKQKERLGPADLSALKVDIHSHLLPGIDDGAATIDDTLAMMWKFQEMGYSKLIMTPHVMTGVYNNTSEIILNKFEETKIAAKEAGITLELECSAEYYLDEVFIEKIKTRDLIPFNGNHILFECSFRNESQILDNAVFTLRSNGYQPVIAHFERYLYYHNRIEVAKRLRDLGVLIQVNINSIFGHYGPEVKKQTELLIKKNLVDIVGTDCHRIQHLQLLESKLTNEGLHELLNLELKNNTF